MARHYPQEKRVIGTWINIYLTYPSLCLSLHPAEWSAIKLKLKLSNLDMGNDMIFRGILSESKWQKLVTEHQITKSEGNNKVYTQTSQHSRRDKRKDCIEKNERWPPGTSNICALWWGNKKWPGAGGQQEEDERTCLMDCLAGLWTTASKYPLCWKTLWHRTFMFYDLLHTNCSSLPYIQWPSFNSRHTEEDGMLSKVSQMSHLEC